MKEIRIRLALIAILALSPILLSSFVWQCNLVLLHLKAWGVEYIFQKGACDLTK